MMCNQVDDQNYDETVDDFKMDKYTIEQFFSLIPFMLYYLLGTLVVVTGGYMASLEA